MKKLLLTFSVALTTIYANSQVAYSASSATDFQAGSIVDADQDSLTWGIYNLMTANGGNPVGTSFDSQQGEVLGSFSWNPATESPLTPDNWFISPAINLTGINNPGLSWGRASVDPDWAAEKYSVYVVTAASPQELILALQSGTAVYSETIAVGGVWGTNSVSISQFANQNNVYVAFRHHDCTDQFFLLIDDIKVENVASINENSISASVHPNPATDILNIKMDEEIASIVITTLDGKTVSTETSTSINISNLNGGMYLYTINAVSGKVAKGTFVKN